MTLVANNRPGHHDVTSKDARLKGAQASVIEAPVYPNTWLSVRLKDPPYKIVKVRTSQLAQPAVDDAPVSTTETAGKGKGKGTGEGTGNGTATATATATGADAGRGSGEHNLAVGLSAYEQQRLANIQQLKVATP